MSKLTNLDFSKGVRAAIDEAVKVTEDSTIRIFDRNSDGYKKLQAVATLLNLFGKETCTVKETYFDYGQNWKWTTIIADSGDSFGGYQKLTPRDQEDILTANSAAELGAIADKLMKRRS